MQTFKLEKLLNFERLFIEWTEKNSVSVKNQLIKLKKLSGASNTWLFEPESPSKALVVFSHATGNDALYPNTELFKCLLKKGISVLTYDLAGHGRSSSSQLDSNSIDYGLTDLLYQIKIDKTKKLVLVGESLGSIVNLRSIPLLNNSIECCVHICTPFTLPKITAFLNELTLPALPQFWRQFPKYKKVKEMFPALLRFRRNTYPIRVSWQAKSRHYLHEIGKIIEETNFDDLIQKIPPSLFVFGDLDKIAPFRPFTNCLENSSANKENIDTVVFKGENHFSLMISEKVHTYVAEWIDNHIS